MAKLQTLAKCEVRAVKYALLRMGRCIQIRFLKDVGVHSNVLSLGCGGASKYARVEWGQGNLWLIELLTQLKIINNRRKCEGNLRVGQASNFQRFYLLLWLKWQPCMSNVCQLASIRIIYVYFNLIPTFWNSNLTPTRPKETYKNAKEPNWTQTVSKWPNYKH